MDIDTLDLNLLRIFDALIRTRNVTSAGEAVGLSQPAVSYALAKLRTLTGDELFVRSRGGMEPTPRAIHMGVPVRQVLDMIRREVFQTDHFIPSEAERVFTLSLSDIGEMVFFRDFCGGFRPKRHMSRSSPCRCPLQTFRRRWLRETSTWRPAISPTSLKRISTNSTYSRTRLLAW
jgi:DNA-binding transcriptional LysR family regulator